MALRNQQEDVTAPDMTIRRNAGGMTAGKPKRQRVRCDGWTAKRRARFLEALSESCNIREACRAAGMSKKSVYVLRSRDPGFAEQWAEALEQGYAELEMMLLHQAIFGSTTTETVDDGAETGRARTKTVHSFPLGTGLRLLLAHRNGVHAYRESQGLERPGSAEVREDIIRRIAEARERLQQQGKLPRRDTTQDDSAGTGEGGA